MTKPNRRKGDLVQKWSLVCLRKLEIALWETLTFTLPLISASSCDCRCLTPGTQCLLSRLSLSESFYEAPIYCLEVDKNNKLAIWPRGVPVMRSWGGYWVSDGVRPAPRTQEGNTVSHGQGYRGRTLVLLLLRSSYLQLSLLINYSSGQDEQRKARACTLKWYVSSGCISKMIMQSWWGTFEFIGCSFAVSGV